MTAPTASDRRARSNLELIELVEELAKKLQSSEPVDAEAFLAQHPEHADQLRRLLPTVRVMADLGLSCHDADPATRTSQPQQPAAGVVGDFRILREIGRGGMGIVYEAQQVSLSRRVALKVLPFAAVLDPKQLQRFKHEAQAAAQLHHTNIVPVHAVGCERGVHYYAMQIIDGQTLAAVIRQSRQISGMDATLPIAISGATLKQRGGRPIQKRHGNSWMSNCGSRAIRSTVSASPFHPINPAVARTRLSRQAASWSMVMRTFACSSNGSGCFGLRTPSPYVASMVMDIGHLRLGRDPLA